MIFQFLKVYQNNIAVISKINCSLSVRRKRCKNVLIRLAVKARGSDSDFKTDYCAQVDRQEINCMPVEIHDITDDDMVEQAINTCAMIMNYSVGRKSR